MCWMRLPCSSFIADCTKFSVFFRLFARPCSDAGGVIAGFTGVLKGWDWNEGLSEEEEEEGSEEYCWVDTGDDDASGEEGS